jgi:short subunit dehydrogenase-like uncharacterized protein
MRHTWMLYGATGYTGRLIAREAVARGHRPLLAGRSREGVEALATELGLPFVHAPLDVPEVLAAAVGRVGLVLNTAGPFVDTAPMVREACLAAGAHMLDITGEVEVFQDTLACDARARERGITVMSGVGFDVVPTDCLARLLVERLPGARTLELAVAAPRGHRAHPAGHARWRQPGAAGRRARPRPLLHPPRALPRRRAHRRGAASRRAGRAPAARGSSSSARRPPGACSESR